MRNFAPPVFYVLAFLILLSSGPAARAENGVIEFATVDMGRKILTAHDDYFTRMGSWDRSARMGVDHPVSEKAYVDFVGGTVRIWSPQEKARINAIWKSLRPKLNEFSKLLPATILFVRTSGAEEGEAEYTRANAIFLPDAAFRPNLPVPLADVVAHEVFHILSRNNPKLRDRLYAIVGFSPCGEIVFPTVLAARKLTNPDAPRNDHCIRMDRMIGTPWAVPITYFRAPLTSIVAKPPFLQSVELKFLLVRRSNPAAPAVYDPNSPSLLDPAQMEGLLDKIGRNTGYIIHPEEILADNFEKLVTGANVPSPQVVKKLHDTLVAASR